MTAGKATKYRRKLRFVLDGEVVEIDNVDPNRTVLQFLREDLRRTGTKEGCAEGDCGACTVVVADIDASGKRLNARAINSCIQFLPTLDGKELLTVESLASGGLHPAQRALVDCHGSQCGFCTPGFVMSLFALYKNNAEPTRTDIDDALAGNLCRCTGYNAIIAAAQEMYAGAPADGDWMLLPAGAQIRSDEMLRIERLAGLASAAPLCVEWQGRKFFAPHGIEKFASLVEEYPQATILAGGTDVGLWVTKQHRDLDIILYTGNVAELRSARTTETHIDIGAAVALTDAMPMIVDQYPALDELFLRFASPPIRNAGTLGGNVANGSPIGDSMPALLALDAELVLRQGANQRTVALADFYLAYQQTDLQPGEFVERIRIPLAADSDEVRSYKVSKRFDQDISSVCGAFRLRLDGAKVCEFRAAFGGMAEVPRRATNCEAALIGVEWNEDAIRSAMRSLDSDFTPISDMRSSSEYRTRVCQNLLLRFYLETTGVELDTVYSYGR